MISISQRILNYVSFIRTSRQVCWRRAVPHIALSILFVLCLPALSDLPHDFSGAVLGVSDQNELYVYVTQPGATGLNGDVQVLLDHPLPGLYYFAGSELQFDILGHDILGRLVCDA